MPSHSRAYKSKRPQSTNHPSAVRALRRAGALQREVEDVLSRFDLTWAQFDTLLALRELGPTSIREAIRRVGEGAPRRIEKLEEKGYVRRRPDPEDGRKKEVVLAEEGEEALSQAILQLESIEVTPDPAEHAKAAAA